MAKKDKDKPKIKFEPFVTERDYPKINDRRLTQIRFFMEDFKVEAFAITHLPNVRYLTNFSGSNAQLFIFKDEIHFVTDDRYELELRDELYNLPNLHVHITRDVWQYGMDSGLFSSIENMAFEADRMGYSDAVEIRNVIRPIKFKPAPCEVEPFTRPKDPVELDYMKQACEMSEKVFQKLLTIIKAGMSERDIAIELINQARKMGSEGEPFDVIVASGPRSALPHGKPTDRKVKKNDILLLDFGCKVNGFSSDITRTICVGKPTKEQKSIYQIVYKAQQNAINNVRPGMNGKILDEYSRGIIREAGYGEFFQHSLGHGIGIMAHENPLITFRKDGQIIPEDSVISIEPGIYLPEKFGMRIEDNVHVTRNGATRLSNAPNELIGI